MFFSLITSFFSSMLFILLVDDASKCAQLAGFHILRLDALKRLVDDLEVRLTVEDLLDFVHPARQSNVDIFRFCVVAVVQPRNQGVALLVLPEESLEDAHILADLLDVDLFVFQTEFEMQPIEKGPNVYLIISPYSRARGYRCLR